MLLLHHRDTADQAGTFLYHSTSCIIQITFSWLELETSVWNQGYKDLFLQ